MAKLSNEWNLSRIRELTEDKNLSHEQGKLIKEFAQYVKEKGYHIESQKTKILHVHKLLGMTDKPIQSLRKEERRDTLSQVKIAEMKISLEVFFEWLDKEKGLRSFQEIEKEKKEKAIERLINDKEFTEIQRDTLKKLLGWIQRRGLSIQTRLSYLTNFRLLCRAIDKDPLDITREDIDVYLAVVDSKYKKKTVFERRKFLLLFFEWLYQKKKDELELIKDISIPREKGTKLPEEILTPEEIKRMVQVADNFRDKAIIILLYETGARKGEFLQLKIKHLELTKKEYGMITIPQGKTDSRKLPLIYSVPHLQNWINCHPRREDPDAPLFITQGAWLGQPLGEDGLKRLLKVRAVRAGIKKRVYPHLFRHARMTELGKELKEQELKKFAGWTASSEMASIYVHLSGQDVSNKLLANAGLIDAEEYAKGKDILKGIKCPRCNTVNSPDIKYCSCGFCLDLKEVNKRMEEKKQEDNSKDILIQLLTALQDKAPEAIAEILKGEKMLREKEVLNSETL